MLGEQGKLDLIAKKARPKQLPLCNYRTPEGLEIENQYYKGEFIHYQQAEMTKAEYAKLYKDDKGTRKIDGTHRVRVAYIRGKNYSRSFCVVFLTDQKETRPPKTEQPEPPEVAEQRIQAKSLMIDETTLAEHGDFSPAQLATNRDQALIKYFSEHPEELKKHEAELCNLYEKWQEQNQPEEPEPKELEPVRFEVGKTYYTRSICDHECIHRSTIASRTEKTITTTEGKRHRLTVYNGVEQFKPHGSYSMAAILSADKFEEQEQPEPVEVINQEQACTVMESNGGPVTDPPPPEDRGTKFDQMRTQLKAGVQVVTAPQLFPTPPDLAARMVELAEIEPGHRVLEPSAGTGNILKAIGNAPDKVAVELNQELAFSILPRLGVSGLHIHQANFLECSKEQPEIGTFDRILMNPPFEKGADIQHIKHALTMLKPGGRLVAICANGPRQQLQLKPLTELWEPLPAGTFAQAGTMVNSALLVIEK
ncbi:methyltransferase [Desulfobulbus rhabdoformis]|nr:methyltransferase [Desulfobulbus rhabdoformis]